MYWYKVYNLVISAVSVVISLLYIMLVAQSCPTLRPHGLSMEFSRQEYWSGLPFPSPGDHPNPGIKPTSLVSPAFAGRFFTISATGLKINIRYTKGK